MPSLDWWGSRFPEILKKWEIPEKIEISIFQKRKLSRLWDEEALYESSVWKLGWRFTARLPWFVEWKWLVELWVTARRSSKSNTGARVSPVPNRPSLFITWACLTMFSLKKIILISKWTTFKMNFIYWSFIFTEYEHLIIM